MFRRTLDNIGDFFNNYAVFEADYVLHGREVESGKRRVHIRGSGLWT